MPKKDQNVSKGQIQSIGVYEDEDYYEEEQLVGLIGDEDTCVGFLAAGIGERGAKGQTNFAVMQSDWTETEVESALAKLIRRIDIAIILITIDAAEKVRPFLDSYNSFLPVILEIPTKYRPYDSEKDEIIQRLKANHLEK